MKISFTFFPVSLNKMQNGRVTTVLIILKTKYNEKIFDTTSGLFNADHDEGPNSLGNYSKQR